MSTSAAADIARASVPHVDVLIVGAGLSGIGAAYHIQTNCPGLTYAILEGREAIGGTWDLFRYPGIRSDSDMYTLGYSFKPWKEAKAIADGPSILNYVRETARENGIERHIRFSHKVRHLDWSSAEARWTVEAEIVPTGERVRYTANWVYLCSGYYDYAEGHQPHFPGMDRFAGRLIHPQFWPADLDYANKRVVVIGSGATAVTLVPAMAKAAAHVTMLQRSPTYVVTRPARDPAADWLRAKLPTKLAYSLVRWKNVLQGLFFYTLARKQPEKVKSQLLYLVRKELGPDFDVKKHFTPRYNPWDERLCLVPDSDLFEALREKKASVVTDEIETITEAGIRLKSGEELPADIIVSATGLKLVNFGGAGVSVDGREMAINQLVSYKGVMYSDLPNLSAAFGYTNASWTLKADLTCEWVCRVLNHMRANDKAVCVPRRTPDVEEVPFFDFSPGYVRRALDVLPKQGSKRPWRLYQNYILDYVTLRFGGLADEALHFVARRDLPRPEAAPVRAAAE